MTRAIPGPRGQYLYRAWASANGFTPPDGFGAGPVPLQRMRMLAAQIGGCECGRCPRIGNETTSWFDRANAWASDATERVQAVVAAAQAAPSEARDWTLETLRQTDATVAAGFRELADSAGYVAQGLGHGANQAVHAWRRNVTALGADLRAAIVNAAATANEAADALLGFPVEWLDALLLLGIVVGGGATIWYAGTAGGQAIAVGTGKALATGGGQALAGIGRGVAKFATSL